MEDHCAQRRAFSDTADLLAVLGNSAPDKERNVRVAQAMARGAAIAVAATAIITGAIVVTSRRGKEEQ